MAARPSRSGMKASRCGAAGPRVFARHATSALLPQRWLCEERVPHPAVSVDVVVNAIPATEVVHGEDAGGQGPARRVYIERRVEGAEAILVQDALARFRAEVSQEGLGNRAVPVP